jgi:hypothetical protein
MRFISKFKTWTLPAMAVTVTAVVVIPSLRAGAEEGAKPAETSVSGSEREYNEKSAKLNTLGSRIEETEKKFAEVVRRKAETRRPEEKQAAIKELVELADQRNKDVEAYNRLKAELTYRFPDQGRQLERRYQTQNKRSVEEMEGAAGLDDLLTRTKKIIEKKYAPFMEDADKKTPTAKITPPEDKPVRLKLEK